jgi:hypothetical protein
MRKELIMDLQDIAYGTGRRDWTGVEGQGCSALDLKVGGGDKLRLTRDEEPISLYRMTDNDCLIWQVEFGDNAPLAVAVAATVAAIAEVIDEEEDEQDEEDDEEIPAAADRCQPWGTGSATRSTRGSGDRP